MTKYIATGKTYEARDMLKAAGFVWDKDAKQWTGDESAKAEFELNQNTTRGRHNARIANAISFEVAV